MKHDLVPVGRIVKPHGIRGKIKVDYYGEDPAGFRYGEVFLSGPSGQFLAVEVLSVSGQPPRLILQLKGSDRIEEAELLVGQEIFVHRSELPELEEGEYYWFEVLGMEVETEEGRRLGTVREILPTGGHDVYFVKGKRREIALPATVGVIAGIDRENRVIRVRRMEGLWETEDEV
jgi:16S rRNA processing protein RimM